MCRSLSIPHPFVMAGPDPAIQPRRHAAAERMGWMAAARAAMTSWVLVRHAIGTSHREAPLPLPVMAGPDPAIQPRRHAAAERMGWMAAARAAMTSWVLVRHAIGTSHREAPLPLPVMAGPDPAIQPRRHAAAERMGWMAAARAAMTSWVLVPRGTETGDYR
jgi:hypothetical protein